MLASTALGRVDPARAAARGACSPSDLEQNEQFCKDLSQAKGRRHVPCIAPIGVGCTATCCPPGYYCCQFSLGGMTCCHPDFGGICKAPQLGGDPCLGACRPGEVKCGRRCCPRGQKCRNGKCCKKCGDKKACCIAGETCCRDKCCKAKERCCVNDDKTMCCEPGYGCAVPILPGDIGIRPRTPVICCPPERLHTNPKLCCPPGQVALRGPGQRVGPGLSPFCCPRARICDGKCCQKGLTGTETCCDGRCVDMQFSPRHCGRCGRQCVGTQRCVNGACVD